MAWRVKQAQRVPRAISAKCGADCARVKPDTYDADAAGSSYAASRVHDSQSSEGAASFQRSAQWCLASFRGRSSADTVAIARRCLILSFTVPRIIPSDKCTNHIYMLQVQGKDTMLLDSVLLRNPSWNRITTLLRNKCLCMGKASVRA